MPWKRDDPDPLEFRRRQLAEQERHLSEQRRLLAEQLQQSITPSEARKAVEPPVWRREDDSHSERSIEPTPARKRNLARQRQRDMVLFFIFIILFCIVMSILLWVAYVHNISLAAAHKSTGWHYCIISQRFDVIGQLS